ncbi:Bifunctional protein GlmU [Candidatus Lokiarchaeum ossiferum]|uniref:Bifunctional protein GlmU n=1 Tax=Candidatus Lokiarchaeum ossiferum TaxID=2951803 RepID=A0ABY6I0T9_9ARCH|nr:Bifunctional protein GlmU [Candidatus Lokiarchaeum sp. B-35]
MLIICPIAGVGSFLQPFTVSKPKAMIKIAGKRIIDHTLQLLKDNFPPETKICFIVGYKKRIIIEYISEHYGEYFNLIFEEQNPIAYDGDIPLFAGIGDAIRLAGKYGRGDDCFIFFSDHFPTEDFLPMIKMLENTKFDGVVNVREVENPQQYGVCEVDSNNTITRVVEKPTNPKSNLAITWGYVFSKRITHQIFDNLDKLVHDNFNLQKNIDFTGTIQCLINSGAKIGVNVMKSPILDFGQIDDFLRGNNFLLNQQLKTRTDKGENIYETMLRSNELQNTSIIPPVFLGKNCNLTNSVIGPNVSIGDNTVITKCIISNSVIGDCTSMENIITESSVIGDFVSMEDLIKNSISIGDSSSIMKTLD